MAPLVILYLPVLTISHGNLVWRMFCKVREFLELPQGKKHNPLMMKALLSQQKEKSKPPNKQNFRNNKPNKGPKPSQSAPSLKNDKAFKTKGKKTVEPHFVIIFGIKITHLNAYFIIFHVFMSCRSLFSTR